MYRNMIAYALGAFIVGTLALPGARSLETRSAEACAGDVGPVAKALYILSNKAPNEVVALSVAKNGTVSEGTFTATGGDGGSVLMPNASNPVEVDPYGTQDAVVRSRNLLYVVNPGSDSISSFAINPCDPLELTLIGSPTQTDGDFPVTIAVSEALNLVCVGTTGLKNGVECFNADEGQLTPDGHGLRSFSIKATTPPAMDQDSISDLFFSEDQQSLYAPVKGGSMEDMGWLSVYKVTNGSVGTTETRSTPDGVQLLFGGFQVPGSDTKLFLSDASFGAVVIDVDDAGISSLVGKGESDPHVIGLCWALYSWVSKSVWVTTPTSNALLAMDLETAAVLGQTNITNANNGIGDFVVPGKYLYGLAGGGKNGSTAAIVTVDISKGNKRPQTVHYLPLSHGLDNYVAGMAYWA